MTTLTDSQLDTLDKARGEAEIALESPFNSQTVTLSAETFLRLLDQFSEIEKECKSIKGMADKIGEIAGNISKRCEI